MLEDVNLYYIGGVVRDEILSVKSFDTDFCYEGNAIRFAQDKHLNIIKTNPEFGTVRVLSDNGEIDIASTRTETYPRKGHLPKVENIGCALKEDLIRRDFTVNAMAKRTTDKELIDYFGGLEDIKNKKLRVLHEASFIDDPTRIIRGLKFSVRFNFELEEKTKELQENYINNINYDMSYYRLKKEIVDAFSLNKQEVFTKFVEEKLYKLLGQETCTIEKDMPVEKHVIAKNYKYPYMIYLGLFDLSKTLLPFTRGEKRIIEWAERLKTEKIGNNTPKESILIHQLRCEYA